MPVPIPSRDPLLSGRYASNPWVTYFETITQTDVPPPVTDEIVDAGGLATEKWVEYFQTMSGASAPAPVENPISENGFISLPWIEFLLDVTG